MRLENVFLSARPIVESLARSTMWSSTTLFSNNRKVQRARPLGGLEQARAISLASFSPSKIRATAGVARCLRVTPKPGYAVRAFMTWLGEAARVSRMLQPFFLAVETMDLRRAKM